MIKGVKKLTERAEQCFVATSDWTGALTARWMPYRAKAYKGPSEILDLVRARAKIISQSHGIPLEKIVSLNCPSSVNSRIRTDFDSDLLERNGKEGVRSTYQFDFYIRPWAQVMLDGFERLGKDLTFLDSRKTKDNLFLALIKAAFIDNINSLDELKKRFTYEDLSRNDKELQRNRIAYYMNRLVSNGYLQKTEQKKVAERIRYTFTEKSREMIQFYMGTIHPLLEFARLAERHGLESLSQRLLSGNLDYNYFYVDADQELSTSIIEAVERRVCIEKPYILHSSATHNQPEGSVKIYIADLRGNDLSANKAEELTKKWWKYVPRGTVITITGETQELPDFNAFKTPYTIVNVPTFFERGNNHTPPNVVTRFKQAYLNRLPNLNSSQNGNNGIITTTQITTDNGSFSNTAVTDTSTSAPESRWRYVETPEQRLLNFKRLLGVEPKSGPE